MHESICIHKKKTFLLIALFVVLCIAVGAYRLLLGQKTTYSSRAEEPETEKQIIGGIDVTDPTKWPFIVQLNLPREEFFERALCSGTLLTPRWILTAGHCVTYEKSGEVVPGWRILVKHGSHDITSGDVKTYRVDEVYRHPEFQELGNRDIHDIALLHLTEDIPNASTITVSANPQLDLEGQMGVYLGWGRTSFEKFPTILKQAVVPLLSTRRVNKRDWYDGIVIDSELPAGYPKGGVSSCVGDSGGPLLVRSYNRWVQAGIIAWAYGCSYEKLPTVTTRLSFTGVINDASINYFQWIRDTIFQTTGETYTGVGTFVGQDLSSKEKAEFIKRIWLNCELQKDDGQPC